MASLTPLSKGLIGLVVLGGMASAVWHLGLKERFQTNTTQQQPASLPVAPVVSPTVTPQPTPSEAPVTHVTPTTSPRTGMSPSEYTEAGRRLLENGDHAQARTHLEQAVQGGDAAAACLLGEMLLKGQGGPVDTKRAGEMFQMAQSHGIICFSAGQ